MDIVLDSNIYRNDFLLRSNCFDLTLDYLKRTKSFFVLPDIIFQETSDLYRRDLISRKSTLDNACKGFNLLMTDAEKCHLLALVDINKEVSNYGAYIKQRLKIEGKHILRSNNDFLPEIMNRCIKRHKPAGEKFQARDVLIWLTIKEYCQKTPQRQIAFISGNYKDFAGNDPKQLDERLSNECDQLNIKIHYFQSINDFLVKQSKYIEFINEDWIADTLNYSSISNFFLDSFKELDKRIIQSWFPILKIRTETKYKIIDVKVYDHETLFVYEMLDGKLVANVEIKIQIEIQLEHLNQDSSTVNKVDRKSVWVAAHLAITIFERQIIDKALTSFEVLD